jgi:hypothetical protein
MTGGDHDSRVKGPGVRGLIKGLHAQLQSSSSPKRESRMALWGLLRRDGIIRSQGSLAPAISACPGRRRAGEVGLHIHSCIISSISPPQPNHNSSQKDGESSHRAPRLFAILPIQAQYHRPRWFQDRVAGLTPHPPYRKFRTERSRPPVSIFRRSLAFGLTPPEKISTQEATFTPTL